MLKDVLTDYAIHDVLLLKECIEEQLRLYRKMDMQLLRDYIRYYAKVVHRQHAHDRQHRFFSSLPSLVLLYAMRTMKDQKMGFMLPDKFIYRQ